MADRIPVIIDNRGDDKVLHALEKLLRHLQRIDIAAGVFEIGLLAGLRRREMGNVAD